MAYSAEISRTNPTCVVFLLDQSGSMAESIGGSEVPLAKAQFLADVANRTLHDLIIRCTKTEEIRDYYHIAILGYGPGVSSALAGPLAGQSLVPISQVAEYPARLESRVKKVPDGAGGLVEQTVRFPIWVDPQSDNGTPMCAALSQVGELLGGWLAQHPNCFPPVVLHITDGESGDGDPSGYGSSILQLSSSDGRVLMFNCHLSAEKVRNIEYPNDASTLPNDLARTLFDISSVLPSQFRESAVQHGYVITEGARGFVFNADAAALAQFFDIGTRPGNLR